MRPERGWRLETKLLAVTVPLIIAVTGLAAWAVQARTAANLQEKLTQRARSLHTQIMADRHYYASVIVPRIEALGGSLGADYQQVHGRFPLPATFLREVSEVTAKTREGYTANLISPWAINPDKGVKDPFQRDAFAYLMKHQTERFVRIDTVEGRAAMRVLMSDFASAQSCVDCHNAHPKSPRHDFKLNDLMGGLEIVIPMDQYLEESRRDLVLTLAGGTGLCLLVMGIVVLGTRQTVTRPLARLAERMRTFTGSAKGPLIQADAVSLGDEVARLEETFGTMVETITYKENELRDANACLEQHVAERTEALQSLVEATRQLTAEPRLVRLLQQLIETARRLTGAAYAALGVFDETGERLTQFVTTGMDEAAKEAIGGLPSGRGLLGHLAYEEGVLRLKDLTQHPASVGFPPHHPPMRSFLGASIWAHGRLYGRLYLTDKQGADEFTAQDEQVIAGLAAQAGVAIENVQLIKEIRTSREQYRATMASLPVSVVRLGKDRTIRLANRTFYKLLQRRPEETIGQPLSAVLPVVGIEDFLRAALATCAGGGTATERELECAMPTGDRLVLRLTASGIHRADDDDDDDDDDDVVLAIEDMTERKRAEEALRQSEEQLRQSQKMEAVGQLAGGIAHDFNNMLTVINGYSQLLLSRLESDAPHRAEIEEINTAGARAAALTRQLLAFSRKQLLAPRVLSLNAVVTNLEQMLQRLIGEDIELRVVLQPQLGRVLADPGQIEQVIMNLALNARDAMPQGGRLTIETTNVEMDESYAQRSQTVSAGPHVLLAMSDTGCGMDEATQARIFEPFFTTKAQDKGTGLGLATVYGIVKQSGGSVWVYSEPGHGTTFKIYLPRVEGTDEAVAPAEAREERVEGSETILVAEDDAGVRKLTVEVLRATGYTVLEAANGNEAIALCERHQGAIHLLATDVVMPGMNGRALAERLIAVVPGMKVLYLSGYTDDTILRHGVLNASVEFLQKPFTPLALARKVREVLDSP